MTDLRTVELIEYGLVKAERIIVLNPDKCRELAARYIAFDTETTGLDPEKDRIVELGVVLFENGQPAKSFRSYVNSGTPVSDEVSAINHINNEVLQGAPSEEEVYPKLMVFLGDAANGDTLICGHVAAFDLSFLCRTLERLGLKGRFRFVDTRQLATQIPELEHHSLAAVAEYFKIPHEHAHQAKEDALTSGRILWKMLERNRLRTKCR